MKYKRRSKSQALVVLLILASLVNITLLNTTIVYAETLESTNYRIDGATIGGSGEVVTSGDYTLYATIGDFSGNPRTASTSYEIRPGNPDVFTATTPTISCFETTSDGSSDCETGPSYLNTYGMVRVCGAGGCYNRARFEIDEQGNPSDTLYGVQISDDGFTSNIWAIDGTTYRPKSMADRQLSDYMSKSDWETDTFNIQGLDSNSEYSLRITALHGDFTESSPSPVETATTAMATVTFDIDITDMNETDPETSPPHSIAFTGNFRLFAGGALQRHDDLIWLDMGTNASSGLAVVQKGLYGGLYSALGSYTITSATANLASASEGFGIQNYDYSGTETYQEDYSGSGGSELGSISVVSAYNGSDHNVGLIDTSHILVYSSDGPIDSGRTALFLKAKAGPSAPAQSDYTEEISFVIVGRY